MSNRRNSDKRRPHPQDYADSIEDSLAGGGVIVWEELLEYDCGPTSEYVEAFDTPYGILLHTWDGVNGTTTVEWYDPKDGYTPRAVHESIALNIKRGFLSGKKTRKNPRRKKSRRNPGDILLYYTGTNIPVRVGDLAEVRGGLVEITYISRPLHSGSTGRVGTIDRKGWKQEYFPSVIGASWVPVWGPDGEE